MDKLFTLEDKVIIITGALGQLGQEYSKACYNSGAKIVAIDLFSPDSEKVKITERAFDESRYFYLQTNLLDKNALTIVLDLIKRKWGTPHVLINNAAIDSPPSSPAGENGPFESYPEESWDKVMGVNVKGVFLACQVFGGAMAIEGRGSIINISSIYGLVSPNQDIYDYRRQNGETFYKPVAYSASKSALFNLTRYLATYWSKKGVRVNTLTLAGVFNNQDKNFLNEYTKRIPIGRMAKSTEYNGAIIFLASDASSYMTGSNLVVDGGWTAW